MNGRRIYNSLSYKKLLGYSFDELKTSSGFDRIHPDDRERVRQATDETCRPGIGKIVEYRIRHKDGSWRYLESMSTVILGPGGEPDKLIVVNRDISERKYAAAALRRSNAIFRS
jgi:PAS domain S-box-containing protein